MMAGLVRLYAMIVLKIIGYLLLGVVTLVVLFIVLIKTIGYLSDKNATRKGKEYCKDRGYTFKKVAAFPNHYGLYFMKDKMHFYASFDYVKNGVLDWKKGTPEEKIAERLEKKRLRDAKLIEKRGV